MSEDVTKNFNNNLLEQIFAKLDVMDTRLQQVEVKIDRPAFDTKPIWERALAEIQLVKEDVGLLKQDVAVLKQDVGLLKQDVAVLKQDVAVLKQDVAVLKQDVAVLKEDVSGIKSDLRVLTRKFEVVNFDMLSLRADQRDLDHRLHHLENKESTT